MFLFAFPASGEVYVERHWTLMMYMNSGALDADKGYSLTNRLKDQEVNALLIMYTLKLILPQVHTYILLHKLIHIVSSSFIHIVNLVILLQFCMLAK